MVYYEYLEFDVTLHYNDVVAEYLTAGIDLTCEEYKMLLDCCDNGYSIDDWAGLEDLY